MVTIGSIRDAASLTRLESPRLLSDHCQSTALQDARRHNSPYFRGKKLIEPRVCALEPSKYVQSTPKFSTQIIRAC